MPSKKLLGAAIVAASVVGGGIAGALVGTPSLTSAQESEEETTTTTVKEERSEAEGGEHRHPGRCHHRPGKLDLGVAAEALGISEEDLREAMRDGSSIADVAEEQDVDVQKVIDALVASATERIDAAVADGDLDADRAAEVKENLPERITAVVNGEMPRGGLRHFQRPGLA